MPGLPYAILPHRSLRELGWAELSFAPLKQVPPDRRDAPLSNGQAQLLTVHGSYTVNLQVSQVPSLADLHALVQEKYWQQVEQMTLRYVLDACFLCSHFSARSPVL